VQPIDHIGIHSTLARIREITAPVAPAPAPVSAVPDTTRTSAFAAQLASAQMPASGYADLLGPLGLSAFTGGANGLPGAAALRSPGAVLPASAFTTPALASAAPIGTAAFAGAQPVPGAPAGTTTGTAGPQGQYIARLAQQELGVREEPMGSNDGARIAEYRTATANAGVGPWCAYFSSWVAAQAGVPIGPDGRGEGWVPSVESWGKQTGRWIPSDSTTPPQAGDMVIFDRNGDGLTDHIGVVTGVRPDGGISTVEGNSSNAVSARTYGPGEYTGVVRLLPPGT